MDVIRASRMGRGRKRVSRRRDRKVFSRTASKSRSANYVSGQPMRGGTRL